MTRNPNDCREELGRHRINRGSEQLLSGRTRDIRFSDGMMRLFLERIRRQTTKNCTLVDDLGCNS